MLNVIKADIAQIPSSFAHPLFHWSSYPMSLSSFIQLISMFLIGASLIVLLWLFLNEIGSRNIAICNSKGAKVSVGIAYVIFTLAILIIFEMFLAGTI